MAHLAMKPKYNKPPPDYRIIKLRDGEEKLRAMKDTVKDFQNREAISHWEHKTDARIKQNAVMDRFHEFRDQAEEALDARRRRLAEKLYYEELSLQEELKSSQETPDERRSKLEKRALELKARSESQRQAVADDLLYKHWRESCDPLRALDSQAVLMHCADVRQDQIQAKRERRLADLKEMDEYEAMNDFERKKMENRYRQDVQKQKERDDEAVRVLNLQVKDQEARKREMEAEAAADMEELRKKWAREAEEERQARKQAEEHSRALGVELKRFNIQKQEEMAERARKEAEEDLRIVQASVRRAEEEEEREQELKDQRKEQDRQYGIHLAMLMQKETVDTHERDELIAAAEAEQRAKYDAEKARENAAREALMRDVAFEREMQIQEKHYRHQMAEEEMAAERARIQEEMMRIAQTEAMQERMLRAERVQHRLDIEAQIRAKEDMRRQEEREKDRDWQGALAAERVYTAMVKQAHEEGPAPAAARYGRKATQWYT